MYCLKRGSSMRLIKFVLLCIILLFCASCAPTGEVTPSPTPTAVQTTAPTPSPTVVPTPALTPEPTPTLGPTPEPEPWEDDPGQFIQDCLEADFAVKGWMPLGIMIDPGSMSLNEKIYDSEVGQAIRDLFAAYDWECVEKPEESDEPTPVVGIEAYLGAALTMENVPYWFYFNTYDNVISLNGEDLERGLHFRAEGAENLCRDVIALSPDFYAQASIVYSPLQETAAATAKEFLDSLFAAMTENGHITDYKLLEGYVLDAEDMIYRVRFRLKPAHPEWQFWSGEYSYYPLNASGWTKVIEMRFWLRTDGERVRFWI